MALVVDRQCGHDEAYKPVAPGYDQAVFLAARELLLDGATSPGAYPDDVLIRWRLEKRGSAAQPISGSHGKVDQ